MIPRDSLLAADDCHFCFLVSVDASGGTAAFGGTDDFRIESPSLFSSIR
jgi:hypothetical protein